MATNRNNDQRWKNQDGETDMKDTNMIIDKIQNLSDRMDKTFEEMSDRMDKTFEEMSDRMDKTFEEMSDRMDKTFEEMSDRMDKTFDEMSGRMDRVVDEMHEGFDRLDHRIDRLEGKVDNLDSRVGNLEHDMKSVKLTIENEVMRDIGILADGYVDLNRKLDEVLEHQKRSDEKVEQIELNMKHLDLELGRVKDFVHMPA